MSIATRTGDDGTTGLVFGQRVPKDHPRVEAVGRFDELNAALGWAKCQVGGDAAIVGEIESIQRDLVSLMGELAADDADQARYAGSKFGKVADPDLTRIDTLIARLEATPIAFDGWATPGKTPAAAALDLARVAARRAERQLITMRTAGLVVRPLLVQFVNRTSDLLWLLARRAES
jgi:cob(I)alamin adenosyltransferase